MWYWMIPSAVLTGACLAIPQFIHTGAVYLNTGGHGDLRNYSVDDRDYYLYMRDRRISGSEFKARGLEYLGKPLDLSALPKNSRIEIPWKS